MAKSLYKEISLEEYLKAMLTRLKETDKQKKEVSNENI